MSKLLSNLPIEDLTPENDYIGIIEKGNLIKSFFLANKHEFAEIKFFTIYGEWGSGKSTLMKYLQKELKGSFNAYFFEAWEYESDNNLAKSLLEFLANKSNSKTDDFLKSGSKLMEGFAKSITFKTLTANINAKEIIEGVEEKTFFEKKEQFKKDFKDWENKITTKDKGDKLPEYNIVFIDDLDRCEPENVLNLLSAIKLFFTFGKKTIFFCGIDKKAITEAVKTKYGEVVKSNEYLEKVFDISFTMPINPDISKLVNLYFDEKYIDYMGVEIELAEKIIFFFKELHFTNPRRIKKVLNKYLVIKRLFMLKDDNSLVLPNIIIGNSGTIFETYLTLYLLILKEFEKDIFHSVFDLTMKKKNYAPVLKQGQVEGQFIDAYNNLFGNFRFDLYEKKIKDIVGNSKDIEYLLLPYFAPNEVENIGSSVFMRKEFFVKDFNVVEKGYEYYFTMFVYDNSHELFDASSLKKMIFSLRDYKNIISNLI